VLNGQELFITASMGISLYPADGIDADTLVKNADVAMYQAKGHGRNTYRFYTPTMNAEALRKLILENNLRKALEREEFVLHYQPLVDLATGRVTGTEALLRWQHPGLGLLAPMEFIPLAEETGLIVPIGEWMLQKACEQGKAWQEAGRPSLRMAVNLSMRQFRQNNVTEMVAGALMRSGLHPGCLDLELTESVVMQDAEETIATLRELKSIGVRLTIDDFGTGYSSLSYLKNLPLSTLKLDQSFVNALTRDRGDEAISRAIVALAHDLSLKVIAEGVETAEQVEFLRLLKCDEVQGFLFSRPVPALELSGIFDNASSPAA
jgi:EAL domain-containing protein (putative c-di-GMP-specific phosphodiesterase class I)